MWFGSCYVAKPAVDPTGKAFWILQDKNLIQLETGEGKIRTVSYTPTPMHSTLVHSTHISFNHTVV